MENTVFFSLSQNKKLVKELVKKTNATLGKIESLRFSDGEVLIKSLTNVKDKDVIIIESTPKGGEKNIFKLLLLIDSVNRWGAKSIKLFIPYFGYSRQERSYDNEPISCEVIAKMLETAKYDDLFIFDMHHPDIQTFFKRKIINIMATQLFYEYYLDYFKKHNIDINDVIIVSPDHGANNRSNLLADLLHVNKVILSKHRPSVDHVEHLAIQGDVKDKTCIIVDDILDTCETIISASKLVFSHGAKKVLVAATHGVFSTNPFDRLKEAKISDIVVTNTIEKKLPKDIKVLDIYPLILDKIK